MDLWGEYRDFLLQTANLTPFFERKYSKLLNFLHNYDFLWIIRLDRNRAYDGLDLRKEFLKEYDLNLTTFNGNNPKVLEVLVAFARRIDNEYTGEPDFSDPSYLFCDFLENLGLFEYENKRFYEEKVEKIVSKWLKRDFRSDGFGSILPIKNPIKDQRTIEIHSQMMEYLRENY